MEYFDYKLVYISPGLTIQPITTSQLGSLGELVNLQCWTALGHCKVDMNNDKYKHQWMTDISHVHPTLNSFPSL